MSRLKEEGITLVMMLVFLVTIMAFAMTVWVGWDARQSHIEAKASCDAKGGQLARVGNRRACVKVL